MEGSWNNKSVDGSPKQNYLYNNKEWNNDMGLGLYDYGARFYNPALVQWAMVDPLAEKYTNLSPYHYAVNNPILFIDRNGKSSNSTIVDRNRDGTYTVVGGNINDGDNGIYLKNSMGGMGELVGYSATPASFFYAEGNEGKGIWQGTIYPYDQAGRNFLNKLLSNNPNVAMYMPNATGGKDYDFKVTNGLSGIDNDKNEKVFKGGKNYIDFYRGMPLLGEKNGKPIFGSARDVGNIGAGLVAGRSGIGWSNARLALDGLESYQNSRFGREAIGTQYAERLGYRIGNQMFQKYDLSRMPGNTHLYKIEISHDVISKGDL